MSIYQKSIKENLKAMGLEKNYDPRHIEAYIRIEHDTLNGLSPAVWKREINIATECINVGGVEHAEGLAQSFGL